MLNTLTIKNFAIIESTSLNFDLGFNVLIGETGAGKTIILKALNFVLGEKPNKDDIRLGSSEMSCKATFSNLSDDVVGKLKEFDIECDDILIITRTFNQDGKSSCTVNGEPVTVGMLKALGNLLCDVFGQHEGIGLLDQKNHLKLLDSYNDDLFVEDKEKIHNLLNEQKQIKEEIEKLGGIGEDRERIIDLLSYQIKEIENANIEDDEDVSLENQISVMSNFEKVSESLNNAYSSLSNETIHTAFYDLKNISNMDSSMQELADRLNSALIEVEDIKGTIKEKIDNMSFSESELDKLTERFELIKRLKKKYGATIEDVKSFLNKSKIELDNISNAEQKLVDLQGDIKLLNKRLYDASLSLHKKRQSLAKEIESKVKEELKALGMGNTSFTIYFKEIGDVDEITYNVDGFDVVEFMFSANAGEKEKSLIKTISGGEMSRFMLAIKNVLIKTENNKLLVFDEIDSGVSGEIGYKVGQKLATLSCNYQVLCITHLPQVTALADKFIFIKKYVEDNHTKSVASYLDDEELAKYLVTLFGGKESEAGIVHANELLKTSREFKLTLNK